MIRYWKRTDKKEADASHLRSDSKNRIAADAKHQRATVAKPWLQDTYNYSSKELTQPDDSYISMGFRKHEHKQRSRRMMDKQLQKYFEKAEQDLLNKQKSDKWRNLKSTFDSYMNLTAAERRRTNVANMRGYQLDKGRKILYSFEDNSVYDIEISEKFLNKISVKTLNHKFSDIEKRSVFDNPFQYPPVSPYRIVWPTAGVTGVGELALANIEKSMNEISTTASAFTQTMPGMMNDFTSTLDKTAAMFQQNIQQNMQQNAAIQTNVAAQSASLAEDMEEDEPMSSYYMRKFKGKPKRVYYNEDGHKPKNNDDHNTWTKRGSNNYIDLIDNKGWEENSQFMWNPFFEPEPQQPITVQNTVNQAIAQDNTALTAITEGNKEILTILRALYEAVAKMSSFDVAVNMDTIYKTIGEAVESNAGAYNASLGTQLETLNKKIDLVLDAVNKKIDTANFNESITNLNKNYQEFIEVVRNGFSNTVEATNSAAKSTTQELSDAVKNISNGMEALKNTTVEKMNEILLKDSPNEETEVSMDIVPYNSQLGSISDVLNALSTKFDSYIQQLIGLNQQIAQNVSNEALGQQLIKIINEIITSRQSFGSYLESLMNGQTANAKMIEDVKNAVTNNTNMVHDGIDALGNEVVTQGQAVGDSVRTTGSLVENSIAAQSAAAQSAAAEQWNIDSNSGQIA